MKKLKSLMYSAGLLALLGACSNNDLVDPAIPSDGALSFSSNIESAATRAIGNNWEANDAIGVYSLLSADQTTFGGFENVEYVTANAGATVEFTHAAANTGIVLDGKTDVDIYAYHPYKADLVGFNYPVNVAQPTKLTDLLYSSNIKALKEVNKPQLLFKHALSKFTLVLSIDAVAGNLVTSLDGLVADQIKGTKTQANFDIKTGVFAGLSADAAIKPIYSINEAKTVVTVTAYMIPGQSLATVEAPLSLNGKTFTWKSTITSNLEGGKSYTMKTALREVEEGKVVLVNPDASIQDWEVGHEDGEPGTIDPEKEKASLKLSAENMNVEALAGSSVLNVTASKDLVWDFVADAAATWLTVTKVEGGVKLDVLENTTDVDRSATVTFSAEGVEDIVFTISQKAKAGEVVDPTEPVVVFSDSFAEMKSKEKISVYWERFKDSGILDKHPNLNYVASDNLSLRILTGNNIIWFPAAADKSFEMQNIKVAGYSDLTLSFMIQGEKAGIVPASAVKIKVGDRELEAFSAESLTGDFVDYTLQIGTVDTEEITISFSVGEQPMSGGIRLGNIAVKGNK